MSRTRVKNSIRRWRPQEKARLGYIMMSAMHVAPDVDISYTTVKKEFLICSEIISCHEEIACGIKVRLIDWCSRLIVVMPSCNPISPCIDAMTEGKYYITPSACQETYCK